MISYLEGTLFYASADAVVVQVGGVGYQVLINQRLLASLPHLGEPVSYWIHTQLREDGIFLLGFADVAEREVFLELTKVSGIGPKLANNVLSQLTAPELIKAVQERDLAVLKSLSGIGKKTAERILLELAERPVFLAPLAAASAPSRAASSTRLLEEVRQALTNLGYRRKEIEPVIDRLADRVKDDTTTVEDAVLQALGMIGG